ncbi:DUF4406 domain-containing protein [Arthrobacter agilis]|uniref:DUF4406 domain-containing protein n=1 Tax=Arthrobacter agilis TaxID=37921 RepID=UPI00278A5887|nr:DUF4406 domain-containing protein [Arthrobacter agilis]MDQ0735314.1 hypothetical protein [Arthrobacter agilis]
MTPHPSSPTTLYLAGPMSGLPDFNYPAFHEAAAKLRAAGYTVLNPAENPKPEPETWQGYMRLAIAQLIQADGIALLPGWEVSRGAMVEYTLAVDLELDNKLASDWLHHAKLVA